jgi:hypothetical protein
MVLACSISMLSRAECNREPINNVHRGRQRKGPFPLRVHERGGAHEYRERKHWEKAAVGPTVGGSEEQRRPILGAVRREIGT